MSETSRFPSELPSENIQSSLARVQGGVEGALGKGNVEKLKSVMEGFGPEAGKQFAVAARVFYEACGSDLKQFGKFLDALRTVRDIVMESVPRGSKDEDYAQAIGTVLENLDVAAEVQARGGVSSLPPEGPGN